MKKEDTAITIAQEHKAFQDANSRILNQCVVNYSILSGDHNNVVGLHSGILQTAYSPTDMERRNQTLYNFDRTEQAMRQLAPSLLEAIPGIGVVPTTTNPVKSENADISEKFVEYHRDNVWDVESFFTMDMLTNGYPGGACYVMMYPRHIGTKMAAYKDGEPYLFHKTEAGEFPIEINVDKTLNIGGQDVDPASIGCEIRERSEVLMDLRTLTVFDVSVQGKIRKSLRDAVSFIVRCTKTIGELYEMYPQAKAQLDELAESLPDVQENPPLDGVDNWLGRASFPRPKFGRLEGNNRILEVYQKFINPCYDHPSGAVITIAGVGGSGWESGKDQISTFAKQIDFSNTLPWKHHKTKTGLPPVVWFPFSMNKLTPVIPASDIQKAEGAQRAWDRTCNAAMVGLTYKASPPIFVEQGTQFSKDTQEWFSAIEYPKAGQIVYYKKPIGQNTEAPRVEPSFGGIIDPNMMALMEKQLNTALNMNAGLQNLPKTVSGESFQAQWTVDQRDLMPLQKIHQRAWFELYELLIGAATSEYYEGQKFLVPEKDKYSIIEFKQEIFGDDFDYILISKINKPVTKKARLDIINMVVDMAAKLGTIPPEVADQFGIHRLFEAMDIEDLGLLENETHPSLVKAKWELAKMCAGYEVPPPIKEDAHRIHASVDLAEIQSVRFLSYSEDVQELITKHYHKHMLELDAFNKIEQKQLQQQAMAQEVGRQQLQMQNQPTPGEPTIEPQPGVVQ